MTENAEDTALPANAPIPAGDAMPHRILVPAGLQGAHIRVGMNAGRRRDLARTDSHFASSATAPAGSGPRYCEPKDAAGHPVLAAVGRFRGTRDQVRQVRAFTSRLLDGWPAADDVVLLASELAANAVVHSASGAPGGVFWVHVTAVPGAYACVEVCDQGGPWVRRDPDTERPHGLDIVRRLAACFGVDGDARTGRIVWARLDLPAPCAATPGPGQDGRAGDRATVRHGAGDGLACSVEDQQWVG